MMYYTWGVMLGARISLHRSTLPPARRYTRRGGVGGDRGVQARDELYMIRTTRVVGGEGWEVGEKRKSGRG